jgi:GMP synthase (glutamine-hydrolysing)
MLDPLNPILILDFGSQYTRLIKKRLGAEGYKAIIQLPPSENSLDFLEWGKKFSVIILSGGPNSVYEEGSPQLPGGFWSYCKEWGIPVLGICYGMQLMVRDLGGRVEPGEHKEYGKALVTFRGLTTGLDLPLQRPVWMSHGDKLASLPPGFKEFAHTESCTAAIINEQHKFIGFQFHPEVTHTEEGTALLTGTMEYFGKYQGNPTSVLEEALENLKRQDYKDAKVISALSGGVDSLVATILLSKVVKAENIHAFYVDTGLQREYDLTDLEKVAKTVGIRVSVIDAKKEFLEKLSKTANPEVKRKIIGKTFIKIFEREAQKVQATHLLQGTLHTDIIESQGSKHAANIKSHHNVGGLPKRMKLKLIEPLRDYFKDDIREMGEELGVSKEFLYRHPFPGPGLAIRILGEVTEEKLAILRRADSVWINYLKEKGLYSTIWQAYAALLPVKSVGVQGDGRSYSYMLLLRAVESLDGMTASAFHFPEKNLQEVATLICNQVKEVNRVVYDITSKPPSTIELE